MNFIKSIFFMACVIAASAQIPEFPAPELPFALPEGLPGAPTAAPEAESDDDSNTYEEQMREMSESLREMASERRRENTDWESLLTKNNE